MGPVLTGKKPLRPNSRNIEHGLELLDQSPFFHGDFGPVELLEGVDTRTRDVRDKLVLLFEVTTIHGLVGFLDLNSNGGLTSLADRDGLVIALDGCAVKTVELDIRQKKKKEKRKEKER